MSYTDFIQLVPTMLLTAICFILTVVFKRKGSKRYPTGPRGWPIIGNLDLLSGSTPYATLTELRKTYGDIYSLKVGSRNCVVVNSWSAINEGLHNKLFCDRPDYLSFHLMYGKRENGFACNDLDKRFRLKKQFLMGYLAQKGEQYRLLEDKIRELAEEMCEDILAQKDAFDPKDIISCSIFNVILYIQMNIKYKKDDERFKMLTDTFEIRFNSVGRLAADFLPFLKHLTNPTQQEVVRTQKILESFMKNEVKKHKDNFDSNNINCMMDYFIHKFSNNNKNKGDEESEGFLTDEELIYLILDSIAGSAVTTAGTIIWCLIYLAKYPNVQRKVQEEIRSAIGYRPPTVADRPLLPYTVAVLAEVQRIACVVPFLIPHRTVSNQETTLQGFTIPGGTDVIFNAWSLFHDPELWEDPMEFKPERFLNKDGAFEEPDHLVIFGSGRRSCPGKSLAKVELFLFHVTMVQRMTVQMSDEKPSMEGLNRITAEPKPCKLIFTRNSGYDNKEE